jgi:hypothetical protein
VGVQFELCALGSGVIGTNMQSKFFVALQLEVAHHFPERCASGHAERYEPPAALGATKAPKMHFINPHHRPGHGCAHRCAATSADGKPGIGSASRDKRAPYHIGVSPIATEDPHPAWAGRKIRKGTKFTRAAFDGLSGILHIRKIFVGAHSQHLGPV